MSLDKFILPSEAATPTVADADDLSARAGLYALLARCLEAEVDATLLDLLRGPLAESLDEMGIALGEDVRSADPAVVIAALAEEYAGLFVVPGAVQPFRSTVETGRMFQPQADLAAAAYKQAGFAFHNVLSGEFPDHVAVMLAFVGRLFERLFEAGVMIITTSNRAPRDLYKDGLNRALFLPFIKLLEDRLEVDELDAMVDYRQDRLAGEPVWFSPADAEAVRAIDRIWHDLTGGREEALVLEVKGRDVAIPRFWAGQARVTFAELCARPLGPADYLALTGAVKLLVLEDIPVMGPTNANEAKRFVTLVDTLYEGHVRLVASAAAAPEALYVEDAPGFTLSVQWHPEYNAANDPVSRPLFAAFGAAVRAWAAGRTRPVRRSA